MDGTRPGFFFANLRDTNEVPSGGMPPWHITKACRDIIGKFPQPRN